MNTINQYYALTIQDLKEIAKLATEAAQAMERSQELPHEARCQPVCLPDIRTKVAAAERMFTRYETLMYANIENVDYNSNTEETWVKLMGMPAVKTKSAV